MTKNQYASEPVWLSLWLCTMCAGPAFNPQRRRTVAARGFLPSGANVCGEAPRGWGVYPLPTGRGLRRGLCPSPENFSIFELQKASFCAGISSVRCCSLLTKPPNPFCSANANSPEAAESQCRPGRMPHFPPLPPPLTPYSLCQDY